MSNKQIKVKIEFGDVGGYNNDIHESEMIVVSEAAVKPALVAMLANARALMEQDQHGAYSRWANERQ